MSAISNALAPRQLINSAAPMRVIGAAAQAVTAADKTVAGKIVTRQLLPALGGLAAGALLWKQHRWLGALGGLAVGWTIAPLVTGQPVGRGAALQYLAAPAAGIALSLYWKKHPALGYLLGASGGGLVAGLVRAAMGKK